MDLNRSGPEGAPLALVTGASGFIGRVLVAHLLGEGIRVRALIRPGTDRGRLPDGEGFEGFPVRDFEDPLLPLALKGVDWVFHLGAALNAPDWEAFHLANVVSTRLLLQAALDSGSGLRRFVHVSSISAMGPSDADNPSNEDRELRPVSLYGRSKALAEEEVRRFSERLPLVVVRPPNVLGSGQRELMTVLTLLRHRLLPLIGNGRPQTSLCFVEDLCQALALCARDDRAVGRTYLVTDGKHYVWRDILRTFARELGVGALSLPLPYPLLWTVAALAEGAARVMGRQSPLSRADLESSRRLSWLFDAGRIRRELGFETRQVLEQEARRIAADFLGAGKTART